MIVYQNNLNGFRNDVETNQIADLVERSFESKLGRGMAINEKRSIANSMTFMEKTVRRANLAESCGVLLEYMIPITSKRVDFIVSGEDEEKNKNFVIIELKQWEEATATDKDSIVNTKYHGDETHPSYQAQSYKLLLQDFNENIYNGILNPYSCAYLHNYKEQHPEPLKAEIYSKLISETPIYFKDDYAKLEEFLHRYVRFGKGKEILYQIEKGKIRPSKKLIDHVTSMYQGNQEFILLDEQKIAYENAYGIAIKSKATKEKSVIIIKGGPGTGKSVISVNLLGGLLKADMNPIFVAPNAAFRTVMTHKLAKTESRIRLNNLFKGSSGFVGTAKDTFDVIIVDEAHRLKNKKAYMYSGENQIRDLMNAGKTVIFFVDDDQVIRPEDIGSVKEIKKIAFQFSARLYEIELTAQFRCSGAEGYVNWLNNTLHIKETANYDGWEDKTFDFKIFSNPNDMRRAIQEKSRQGFNARILAGYAWKWTSVKNGNRDSDVEDIEIPEYDFSMPWNSRKVGSTWAIEEDGIHQVGCIHTSQGLEFDYVGVIVGEDLCFDKKQMDYFANWDAYKDNAGKIGLRENPKELTKLVKNIYKVLMSRGMRGCYVYFRDQETEMYFKSRLNKEPEEVRESKSIELFDIASNCAYINRLPVYSFAAACGKFGEGEDVECEGWIEVTDMALSKDMFVCRAVGKSMEPKIKDGEYCIFRKITPGTRQNKIVLTQMHNVEDPETGGKYAIKKYNSEKEINDDGEWRHKKIILSPLNKAFEPIIFTGDYGEMDGEVEIIGELVKVLSGHS